MITEIFRQFCDSVQLRLTAFEYNNSGWCWYAQYSIIRPELGRNILNSSFFYLFFIFLGSEPQYNPIAEEQLW